MLDCLIIGGGPAGLTAGLYFARYGRSFALVDAGDPRAAWIPVSHNIPFFAEGISGPEILARGQAHLDRYGPARIAGEVVRLARDGRGGFRASARLSDCSVRTFAAHNVLLATGADDIEPDLPELPRAIRNGLVRYCPICDGFEARGKRIAVIGHGAKALGEAVFLASTYSGDVTLLTLGREDRRADEQGKGSASKREPDRLALTPQQQDQAARHGIAIVREAVERITTHEGRVAAVITQDGHEHRFDAIYSALGLRPRSDLAAALGAERDESGALIVDDHCRTSTPGLYAAGGVVRGLDQVVIAMGHAAVAATDIHNALRQHAAADRPARDQGRLAAFSR